jgi:heme-degrading monooxygenase HmoA
MDEKAFSLGIFQIKPGKEAEFIEVFQNFAKWVFSRNLGAIDVHLLQDVQQPGRFITVGPWESFQKIDEWRKLSEFKEFFSKVKELSLDVTPLTMKQIFHLKG